MTSCIQRRDSKQDVAVGGIYRLDDGESGHNVEGSIRLQGMLGKDCKSSSLYNNVAHAKLLFIQPQDER